VRVAVISDIHANLRALDAVLAAAGSVDAVWQLGDVVGYGPDPNAVIERLRGAGAVGVRGNHDDAALGLLPIDEFNDEARLAAEWTRARLDDDARAYLSALPYALVPEGFDFTLVHASPRDPTWEYVDSPWAARDSATAFKTACCLVGHTHVPLAWREKSPGRGGFLSVKVASGFRLRLDGRRAYLNPGSVGQPRDGSATASFMVIDTDADDVAWHRVAYDVEAVTAAMIEAGLPARLARRLRFGT
jgi:predicted phosphodiesterase